MTCFHFVLMFVLFISSVFAYNESSTSSFQLSYKCKRGGTCSTFFSVIGVPDKYTKLEPKIESSCYYYKCKIGLWIIIEGAGTYEDFIHTCKYLDPMIKQEAEKWKMSFKHKSNFMYNDNNLILAVCRPPNQQECEKILKDKETYKKIHEEFDEWRTFYPAFPGNHVEVCSYNNTPLVQLPQVLCETGGICQAGNDFDITKIRDIEIVNKTCDACVMFICTLDGKQIIEGSGCYDDFVKACKNANPYAVAKFKDKFRFNQGMSVRDEGIKNNLYYDSSLIVASCSDADNCHKYAFDNYVTEKILESFFIYVNRSAREGCSYEKMIETTIATFTTTKIVPPVTAPEDVPDLAVSTLDVSHLSTSTDAPVLSDEQKSSGSASMKLFIGIYFILALIY